MKQTNLALHWMENQELRAMTSTRLVAAASGSGRYADAHAAEEAGEAPGSAEGLEVGAVVPPFRGRETRMTLGAACVVASAIEGMADGGELVGGERGNDDAFACVAWRAAAPVAEVKIGCEVSGHQVEMTCADSVAVADACVALAAGRGAAGLPAVAKPDFVGTCGGSAAVAAETGLDASVVE